MGRSSRRGRRRPPGAPPFGPARRGGWGAPPPARTPPPHARRARPPPPARGALLRLGTMGELEPASLGQNTSPYVHALTEISKNSFSQTSQYAADPPLDELLTEAYFAEQAAKS